jgi:predicted NBD/HSP70 family sugar kinase
MKYFIALDIGATKILGAIVKNNKVEYSIKKPTQSKAGKVKVVKNIENIIEELIVWNEKKNKYRKLEKIGIGFAGQIDSKNGIILSTGNFSSDFKNIKLAEILNKKFKVKVQIDNDVKCFMKAEMKYGVGKKLNNAIGLTFGTGIGGAIMMDKKLWTGKNNTAGEVGFMKIAGAWVGALPKSENYKKYAWEVVASGKAWWLLEKKTNAKKADEIIINNIVIGLLNLSHILNPESFILGGGLMEHKDFVKKIRKEFNKQASWPWFKKIRIVRAGLGDDAILLGSLL